VNSLPTAIVAELHALFRAGIGVRASARRLGISKITAQRYYREFPELKCPCGEPARHRGWCQHRVALSPERQNFLSRFVTLRPQTIERWLAYSVKFETRIKMAFGGLKQVRKEALRQMGEPANGAGFEFGEDGQVTRVQTVEAIQSDSSLTLRKKLAELHPSVRSLCESVLDGATLDQAAKEANLTPDQLKMILPKLKLFLRPLVETA
jgi:hypothetical protein